MSLCAAVFLAFSLVPDAVAAGKRVALVIGNSDYEEEGRLRNPVNDATLITETLTALDFDVELHLNSDQRDMKRAIKDFGRRLEDAGEGAVGLFFYAGHGVQHNGENFLIPVDARIDRLVDVEIEGVKADWVVGQMEASRSSLNFVILDACRDNPYVRDSRSAQSGLARLDAPTGTLIAYSTAPGDVAVDGDGRHSPYAFALARHMRRPGIAAEQLFRTVRVDVLEKTGERQTPWESSSLTGAFYFNDSGEISADPQPSDTEDAAEGGTLGRSAGSPGVSDQEVELAFWQSAKDAGTPEAMELYLDRYPDGTFADLARLRLETVKDRSAGAPDATAEDLTQSDTEAPDEPVEKAGGGTVEVASIDPVTLAVRTVSNVRTGPTTGAAKLITLGTGTRVRVVGKAGNGLDWYAIDLEDGRRGYIWHELLVEPEKLPAMPPAQKKPEVDPAKLARLRADLGGLWEGRYRCQDIAVGLRLNLVRGRGNVAGRVDFFPLPGEATVPSGAYQVFGRYDQASGRIMLKPGAWLDRPPGFQKHGFSGQLTPGADRLTGRVTTVGCRRFILNRR